MNKVARALAVAGAFLATTGLDFIEGRPSKGPSVWSQTGVSRPVAQANLIAFYSDRDGDTEVYVMAADGSAVRQLTQNAIEDRDPAWAPDGKRLAFISRRDGNQEIYIIGSDGGGLRRLTTSPGSDHSVAWSPDSSRIAYVSDVTGNQEIYVVPADGSQPPVNVTNESSEDGRPSWAPDGRQLVFVSNREFRESHDDSGDLYVADIATRRSRRLQPELRRSIVAEWSPDGKAIASFGVPQRKREIFVIAPDGAGLRNLSAVSGSLSDINPVWSPDGARIAFQGDRANDGALGVLVMNADGSGAKRLSRPGDRTNGPPSWSSDGRHVAFSAFEEGNWEIYTAPAAGGEPARLTRNRAMDLGATWSRATPK